MRDAGEGPGRKQAPPRMAKLIQSRLRKFLEKEYGTVHKFIEGYPRIGSARKALKDPRFSRQTVQGWLRGNRIPDSMSVIMLAEVTQLNPQCLLLGEGDALRGVELPRQEMGRWLHQRLEAELRADGFTPLDIEDFLPEPDDLLLEVVASYRARCRRLLSEERRQSGDVRLDGMQKKLELLYDMIRVEERRRETALAETTAGREGS